MKRKCLYKTENELCCERYELAVGRIMELRTENTDSKFHEYFEKVSCFVEKLDKIMKLAVSEEILKLSNEELKKMNHEIYYEVLPQNYTFSYSNPDYACKKLGKSYGRFLAMIFAKLHSLIYECYNGNMLIPSMLYELVLEVYGIVNDDAKPSAVKKAIYYFYHDYCYELTEIFQKRRKNPDYNEIIDIVKEADLSRTDYLYLYGSYIGHNELEIHDYLNKADEKEVSKMAETFVSGYVRGFETQNMDFSLVKNVEIRYPVGFERVVRIAVNSFEKMGKRVIMYMDNSRRTGTSGVYPGRQFLYDHRNDEVFFYDKKYEEVKKECLDKVCQELSDCMSCYAGPACIETFGEERFTPVNKDTVIVPGEKENKIALSLRNGTSEILHKYTDYEKVSFTIIAYPLPDIGGDFEQIFAAVNEINTLDNEVYKEIQQRIIDVLDKGDYVVVKGSGDNKTDIKIMLHTLKNPDKETNFENCTADVNIPAGEVFTSPVLKGTDGVLNVSHAFLEGFEYKDLVLEFKDGMVKKYSCSNFGTDEENKNFIFENILFRHETLPVGEFAIGTNTTAYKYAGKFEIWDRLPILIAEKTGPHFAVGDTCYSDMEDFMTYNPDGKAIVARDNEISALRKTDRSKAYFNCHTDITIPYHELDYIRVHTAEGEYSIIEKGRFTVPGTELLNESLS